MWKLLHLVVFLVFWSSAFAEKQKKNGSSLRYQIAQFDWPHVATPYTVALWILLASIAKIGFHLSKKFSSIFPDSSLLIVLGLMVGLILYFAKIDEKTFRLESEIFFLFLLPQIVFDAGYFMPNRAFFDHLGTILVYAVIGTLWNMATIGLSLYYVGQVGIFDQIPPVLDCLLFSSLISAVDPVAVLVVFEEIHVNEILFIVVFGESLLNDAVTVVLYHMFETFSEIGETNIITQDVVFGFISFFVVGLGGVLIGVFWAAIISFTTRWTKHVRVLEPLIVLIMAYCSYLTAEMLHLSGILAIVFCGITMKQYVEGNICQKSNTTVKYFLKMLSNSSETIIFMFLGLSTVSTSHHWDTAFVGLTVLFCLIYRALGVVIQTFFLNMFRLNRLDKVEQFVMAYGGLRGAIAYGLVVALPETIQAKDLFVTACIVVIYFTVFLQGMTIKPLVNFLKVKKEEQRQKTMLEQIFERTADHAMAGAESIAHQHGHHWLRNKYEYLNTKYLKKWLMREPPRITDTTIIEVYTKLSMKDAMDHMTTHGTFAHRLISSRSEPVLHAANGNVHLDDTSFLYPVHLDSDGNIKHLNDDAYRQRKHRRRAPNSISIDSDDSDDDSPRNRRIKDAAKRVSFSLDYPTVPASPNSKKLVGPPYPDSSRGPSLVDPDKLDISPTSGRKLTTTEKELPWKEYNNQGNNNFGTPADLKNLPVQKAQLEASSYTNPTFLNHEGQISQTIPESIETHSGSSSPSNSGDFGVSGDESKTDQPNEFTTEKNKMNGNRKPDSVKINLEPPTSLPTFDAISRL